MKLNFYKVFGAIKIVIGRQPACCQATFLLQDMVLVNDY